MTYLNIKYSLTALCASTIFAGNANAVSVANPSTCLDSNTIICIQENYSHTVTNNDASESIISRYTITNNGTAQVYGFGVTNSLSSQPFIGENFEGWKAATVSRALWDGNRKSILFSENTAVSQNWATGTSVSGYKGIGTFDDLFVSESDVNFSENNVNFYWNSGNENPLTQDASFNDFYFYGSPESRFAAFDVNGDLIASSLTTIPPVIPTPQPSAAPVPEPQTLLMFLAGLGLLGFASRRRKQ